MPLGTELEVRTSQSEGSSIVGLWTEKDEVLVQCEHRTKSMSHDLQPGCRKRRFFSVISVTALLAELLAPDQLTAGSSGLQDSLRWQ